MNPNALEVKARQRGWRVVTEREATASMITMVRDDWEIRVSFSGSVPISATIREPGSTEHRKLPLREIGRCVRADRHRPSRGRQPHAELRH